MLFRTLSFYTFMRLLWICRCACVWHESTHTRTHFYFLGNKPRISLDQSVTRTGRQLHSAHIDNAKCCHQNRNNNNNNKVHVMQQINRKTQHTWTIIIISDMWVFEFFSLCFADRQYCRRLGKNNKIKHLKYYCVFEFSTRFLSLLGRWVERVQFFSINFAFTHFAIREMYI